MRAPLDVNLRAAVAAKGINFDDETDAQIGWAENRLNNRPRKRLNWQTPQRVFDKSFNPVALRK
jgi:IS30 family transposase